MCTAFWNPHIELLNFLQLQRHPSQYDESLEQPIHICDLTTQMDSKSLLIIQLLAQKSESKEPIDTPGTQENKPAHGYLAMVDIPIVTAVPCYLDGR